MQAERKYDKDFTTGRSGGLSQSIDGCEVHHEKRILVG